MDFQLSTLHFNWIVLFRPTAFMVPNSLDGIGCNFSYSCSVNLPFYSNHCTLSISPDIFNIHFFLLSHPSIIPASPDLYRHKR